MSTTKLKAAALAKAVRELLKSEWMVTHDWGGDRQSVLSKTQAALAAYEAAPDEPAKGLLEAAKREYPRDKNLQIQLRRLMGAVGINEIKGADDNPAKIQQHATDNLCEKCGIGWILPSGVCDHCNQKAAPGEKPGADWMRAAADELAEFACEKDDLFYPTSHHRKVVGDQFMAIIARHAQPTQEISARELISRVLKIRGEPEAYQTIDSISLRQALDQLEAERAAKAANETT